MKEPLALMFQIGPILLIPVTVLWAVISHQSCPASDECNDSWRMVPMYGVLILAALWHLALVVTQKERKFYLAYAAFHFPVFYFFWAFALVFAIKFPL